MLTLVIIIFVLGILVLWRLKKQTLVRQSTMEAEMTATASAKVQLDCLQDVISDTELGTDMTRCIFNHGLNCITRLKSGNFQSESRHLRQKYLTIPNAIAKGEIKIKHVAGTETLANALTKSLGEVKLG
jgi:hypothetical protein